jgi:hypothetical protein
MELISIHSITNHSQKKLGNFLSGKNQLLIGKSPNLPSQNQLERNREIRKVKSGNTSRYKKLKSRRYCREYSNN